MLIEAIVSKLQTALGNAAAVALRLTANQSLAVAQVEPDGHELTRASRRFLMGPQSGVTGIAPVQALPTTAAQWLLYNPASNTKTLFVEHIGILLVSGTAGAGIVLLAAPCQQIGGVNTLPATLPTASAAGLATANANALSSFGSALIVVSGQTLASAPKWAPIAKSDSANTAVLSVGAENRDLRGRIAIPPGCGLALAVLSPAGTTPLYAPYGVHYEIESTLE